LYSSKAEITRASLEREGQFRLTLVPEKDQSRDDITANKNFTPKEP